MFFRICSPQYFHDKEKSIENTFKLPQHPNYFLVNEKQKVRKYKKNRRVNHDKTNESATNFITTRIEKTLSKLNINVVTILFLIISTKQDSKAIRRYAAKRV